MPFSHYNKVFAETVGGSSPIIGVNVSIIDRDITYRYTKLTVNVEDNNDRWKCISFNSSGACNAYGNADTNNATQTTHQIIGDVNVSGYSNTTTSVVEYEFILDASYVGYIVFDDSFGYTTTTRYYVNGSSFKVSGLNYTSTFTVTSYSLTRNTLGNEWQFPIESFPWCSYMINNLYDRYYGLNSFNSYIFPIFDVQPNDVIYSGNTNGQWTWDLIFYANRSVNATNIANYITIPSTASFANWTMLNRFNLNGTLGYLLKVQIVFNTTGSSNAFQLRWHGGPNADLDALFMPIYFNPVYQKSYISTDFALNFGLSNQLLDDIHFIAENITASQESTDSVNDNDDMLCTFDDASDDLIGTESDLSDGFNDSMNNIPTNFDFVAEFGTKFSSSAQWVRKQFNDLTLNNPFGSLITFSLILGVGLLLVGRKLL